MLINEIPSIKFLENDFSDFQITFFENILNIFIIILYQSRKKIVLVNKNYQTIQLVNYYYFFYQVYILN